MPDTSFPIPSGARFVSPKGSDRNPGSSGAPFASIRRALAATPSGGTIVLRAGSYRESLGSLSRRVTIQAFPHEQAWIKGSRVITGWKPSGGKWSLSWKSPFCDNCFPGGILDKSHPAAGMPEQVFVNGAPLAQATSAGGLKAHSFFYDRGAHRLVLSDNPGGKTVEVTQLGSAVAIGPRAAGTLFRGIGFEHWGTTYNGDAAVTLNGNNITLDHDTFAWAASRAIGIYGDNNVVANSRIFNNGMTGVNAHRANGLDFEHNEVSYSNYEHWSIEPSTHAQTAGVKQTSTLNTVYRGNDFHNNDSNGLWFDMTSAYQVIVSNRFLINGGHGMSIEISGHSIVAENVIADNGRDGLKLAGANDAAVFNNTIVGNGWAQIDPNEDSRHYTGPASGDSTGISIGNNVLMAAANAQKPVLYSFANERPARLTTLRMLSYDDHNVYGRTNKGTPKDLLYAQMSAKGRQGFTTLAAYQHTMHRESSSVSSDGWSFARMFVAPSSFNFQLAHGAPAAHPASLPKAVAAALSTSTNINHIGA